MPPRKLPCAHEFRDDRCVHCRRTVRQIEALKLGPATRRAKAETRRAREAGVNLLGDGGDKTKPGSTGPKVVDTPYVKPTNRSSRATNNGDQSATEETSSSTGAATGGNGGNGPSTGAPAKKGGLRDALRLALGVEKD